MNEQNKHIDELVANRDLKQHEVAKIGQQIASSSLPIVVAFIDLADSTQMKQEKEDEPEEWLGYVFRFIRRGDQLTREAGGTVVKRIGDELMVTFADIAASERFISSLISDPVLAKYRYKVAIDFGNAYHFRFVENFEDDPYGVVVDRCARIAKYARAGVLICTSQYQDGVADKGTYVSLGNFPLRGFTKPQTLFVRSLIEVDSANYLSPLIERITGDASRLDGYRSEGRKLTVEFIRDFGGWRVRPFIARELLNVPRLPYSAKTFAATSYQERKDFLGYFVEWEGFFRSFNRSDDYLRAKVAIDESASILTDFELIMPLTLREVIKSLVAGQRICVRGVIDNVFGGQATLNYVDFEIPDLPTSNDD